MPRNVPPISAHGSHNFPKGNALLKNPFFNKGLSFSESEQDALGIQGLVPSRVFSLQDEVVRALAILRSKPNDMEKYQFLRTLQDYNETLFFRLAVDNLTEVMPLIYTPTVGQACLDWSKLFVNPRGIYITINDRGRIKELLRNWSYDARLIVVTDGERILGLGDLGANGMGIPVGKLGLYTGCAGLHPSYILPITIDVGTENEKFLEDPLYIGLKQKRVRGAEYDALIQEFVEAVKEVFPGCLVQWEDFGNTTAFQILENYRHNLLSFNDDIQGTASVSVAGLIASMHITKLHFKDNKILFLGAGEAGTGIGELFVAGCVEHGMKEADARKLCWYFDSKGLVVKSRTDLAHHKKPFAHDYEQIKSFEEAVHKLKPTAIIGVSTISRAFTKEICEAMAKYNERPVIMALSNPTSKAEVLAQDAYDWTNGKCVYISGSPMPPTQHGGKTYQTGQGNNVYIFPGVGLGALAANSKEITDEMFLRAAETVAAEVTQEDIALGRVYPAISRIREVSMKIAANIAELCYERGLAQAPRPAGKMIDYIKSIVWEPGYDEYI
jgi:malate dehydrogenase (oxaloacetate-decarboxylating)(NADP+)